MKQIVLLTLFQSIVTDFFSMASKNFDTGANHFLVETPFADVIQILFIENSVSAAKNCNRTSIFLQNFLKPMKQILVLTLFQCIVSDFFTRASKNFDTGGNHFLVKTPFTGCHHPVQCVCSTVGVAQYRGVFSTMGDIMSTVGGYLEYRGGVQYRGGYLEYRGGVHYHGDIMSTVGGYLEYHEGCSVPWGIS